MTEQQYFVIGDTYEEDVMDSLSDVANISERSIAYKDSDRIIIFLLLSGTTDNPFMILFLCFCIMCRYSKQQIGHKSYFH